MLLNYFTVYTGDIYKFQTPISQLTQWDYQNSDLFICSSFSSNKLSSFINDVVTYTSSTINESIDITTVLKDNDDGITSDIRTNFPLFFDHQNKIKVPSKVEYAVKRFIPKGLLKEIHSNFEVAVEMCLLFTTQLTSTYFEMLDNNSSNGWKALKAEYLRDFLCIEPLAYKKIRTALEYPLKTGAILECDHTHQEGVKSFHYRLGEAYIKKGIVTYELTTIEAKKLLNRRYMWAYKNAMDNPICKNLIEAYSTMTLPTIGQIKLEARRLTKMNYQTKKNKTLKFLNKHSRTYFKNPEQISFVEDSIAIFQYLTDNGLVIPTPGSIESGGRVIDSFTLMPSWIRKLVKFGNKANVECDYSCLHPNLAVAIYGGKGEYLTHDKIEQVTGIEKSLVKIEHLSFFNKKVWQMKESVLWDYYDQHEPNMMSNIINEKYNSEFNYKTTSRRLFELEVKIMTDVISILNTERIYVGYVYDALICHPKDAERVKSVMEDVVLKHGVKTTAKLSTENQQSKVDVQSKNATLTTANINTPIDFENNNNLIDTSSYMRIHFSATTYNASLKKQIREDASAGIEREVIDAVIFFDDGSEFIEKVLEVNVLGSSNKQYILHSYVYETRESIFN